MNKSLILIVWYQIDSFCSHYSLNMQYKMSLFSMLQIKNVVIVFSRIFDIGIYKRGIYRNYNISLSLISIGALTRTASEAFAKSDSSLAR